MAIIKKINVNLTTLDDNPISNNEVTALEHFFQDQKKQVIWDKYQEYNYSYNQVNYKFVFGHSVIKRPSSKHPDQNHFELYDPGAKKSGAGGFSTVYPIIGNVKFKVGKIVFKDNHPRVVKIEDFRKKSKERFAGVTKEYNHLVEVGHLGVKQPIFSNKDNDLRSFLIMDKADGHTLHQIIKKDLKGINRLTFSDRLALSLAILEAIKQQVVDKGFIHRDLKPLNMLVDMAKTPPKVTIIDFGNAIKVGEVDGHFVGTFSYMAPEAFQLPHIHTTSVDDYAAGRILSNLWGDDYENYFLGGKKNWQEIKEKSTNKKLFSRESVAVFAKDQKIIRETLQKLLREESLNRETIDYAHDQLKKIDCRKYEIENIRDLSNQELKEYELRLTRQLKKVAALIDKLQTHAKDLNGRGHVEDSKVIATLSAKLKEHTTKLFDDPNPIFLEEYCTQCTELIKITKPVLQNNRNSRWIVGEVLAVIALLGVGYLAVSTINYCLTGRYCLFSQTTSDGIAEEVKNNISILVR